MEWHSQSMFWVMLHNMDSGQDELIKVSAIVRAYDARDMCMVELENGSVFPTRGTVKEFVEHLKYLLERP